MSNNWYHLVINWDNCLKKKSFFCHLPGKVWHKEEVGVHETSSMRNNVVNGLLYPLEGENGPWGGHFANKHAWARLSNDNEGQRVVTPSLPPEIKVEPNNLQSRLEKSRLKASVLYFLSLYTHINIYIRTYCCYYYYYMCTEFLRSYLLVFFIYPRAEVRGHVEKKK